MSVRHIPITIPHNFIHFCIYNCNLLLATHSFPWPPGPSNSWAADRLPIVLAAKIMGRVKRSGLGQHAARRSIATRNWSGSVGSSPCSPSHPVPSHLHVPSWINRERSPGIGFAAMRPYLPYRTSHTYMYSCRPTSTSSVHASRFAQT